MADDEKDQDQNQVLNPYIERREAGAMGVPYVPQLAKNEPAGVGGAWADPRLSTRGGRFLATGLPILPTPAGTPHGMPPGLPAGVENPLSEMLFPRQQGQTQAPQENAPPEPSQEPTGPVGGIPPTGSLLDRLTPSKGAGETTGRLLGAIPGGVMSGLSGIQIMDPRAVPLAQSAMQAKILGTHLLWNEQMMRERQSLMEQRRLETEQIQRERQATAAEDFLNQNATTFKTAFPGLYDETGRAKPIDPYAAPGILQSLTRGAEIQATAALQLTAIDKEFKGAGYSGANDPRWLEQKAKVVDTLRAVPGYEMLAEAADAASRPSELFRAQQSAGQIQARSLEMKGVWDRRYSDMMQNTKERLTLEEGMRQRLARYQADLKSQNPNEVLKAHGEVLKTVASYERQSHDMYTEANAMLRSDYYLMASKDQKKVIEAQVDVMKTNADQMRATGESLRAQVESQAAELARRVREQGPSTLRTVDKPTWDKLIEKYGADEVTKKFQLQTK